LSRLDSFIRRLQAQKACIESCAGKIGAVQGPIVELGLGNGRTYDHLRELFPDRAIYVFERAPNAHASSMPTPPYLIVGDLTETLPRAATILGRPASLLHSDIGCGDPDIDHRTAQLIAGYLEKLVAPGGYVISDQPLAAQGFSAVPMPEGVDEARYTLLQRWTGKKT